VSGTRTVPPAHATLLKFGYPGTVVADYAHWSVLLRPQQVTLGSLVLICKEDRTAFPDISIEAFAEMKQVTHDLEAALAAAFRWDRVNYLMLRMVDPHVHFHVVPRYETARTFGGETFTDTAWPKPPDLGAARALPDDVQAELLDHLRERFSALPR
jgi:diadenosine tetraphosphate (Ap4A) HIT family hydrolase